MKRLGVFLFPLLYSWVERATVRVKYPVQEHYTMSRASARTWTAQSRDERTNHEPTTSPHTSGFDIDIKQFQ